jgi:hypothetical protein
MRNHLVHSTAHATPERAIGGSAPKEFSRDLEADSELDRRRTGIAYRDGTRTILSRENRQRCGTNDRASCAAPTRAASAEWRSRSSPTLNRVTLDRASHSTADRRTDRGSVLRGRASSSSIRCWRSGSDRRIWHCNSTLSHDLFSGPTDHFTWTLHGKREIYIPYNAYRSGPRILNNHVR